MYNVCLNLSAFVCWPRHNGPHVRTLHVHVHTLPCIHAHLCICLPKPIWTSTNKSLYVSECIPANCGGGGGPHRRCGARGKYQTTPEDGKTLTHMRFVFVCKPSLGLPRTTPHTYATHFLFRTSRAVSFLRNNILLFSCLPRSLPHFSMLQSAEQGETCCNHASCMCRQKGSHVIIAMGCDSLNTCPAASSGVMLCSYPSHTVMWCSACWCEVSLPAVVGYISNWDEHVHEIMALRCTDNEYVRASLKVSADPRTRSCFMPR